MLTDINMRHFTCICLLLFFCLNTILKAQNLSALDDNNGFQNYKFGMNKSDFQDCSFETVQQFENKGAELCELNKIHRVNDLVFNEVKLFFIDSKLRKVLINSYDYQTDRIADALHGAFGSPTDSYANNSLNSIRTECWSGDLVTLCHQYQAPTMTTMDFKVKRSYHFEFYINNFDELLDEFLSKKYTPSDF